MKLFLIAGILITQLTASAAPLFRDFMGVNTHTIQFKPDLYAPVASLARDYHPVEWDLGKDSDFTPPFPEARNRVNWNDVYGSWKKRGFRVDVSLMFETLPRDQWKNLAADSRAYAECFARAFGPSSANPLVESVEIGNEPGKFNDEDYRVIFENMARGFRAADPKLLIATCNLTTGKSHAYAKSVTCIAGLENLCDILNIHSYAQLEPWPTWRRSFPEDPRLKEHLIDIRNLAQWRDRHARNKPIWLTEFGYDSTTKTPDPNTEFKKWIGVTDQQQAQWLVRSFLTFASLPIDRAYIYFFNDSDEPKLHAASGLTRNFKPKPAYHAVAHLRKTLGDYRLNKTWQSGEIQIAEFLNDRNENHPICVLWLPTGENKTASFDLAELKRPIQKAERMPLSENENVDIPLAEKQLTITESPTYLFLK